MLMLNTSSAAKLVAMTMASFMLASSSTTFAAPVLNLHGSRADTSLPSIDCVKIQSNDINRASLVQEDQVPFKIDVSGCDPALVDTTQPWTITLVNCQNHADTLKLADLAGGGAEQKEFNWAIETQQLKNLLNVNTNHIASTPDSNNNNKYHIQVDATSKDGTVRLTGKTASFLIDTNDALHKRDDDNAAHVVTPITDVSPATDDNATPATDMTPIPDADITPIPTSDIVTVPNEVTDVNNVQDISPAATVVTPVTPATPVTLDVPAVNVQDVPPADDNSVVPAILNSLASPATNPVAPAAASPSPSPAAVIPSPTYPNLPLEIVDPSQVVNPTGPNQAAKGDPAAPKIIMQTKQRTTSDVFLTYAGAGSAILSTIGLGLGGLVGGVVGGAVGLVIGLSAALVNSLYYAPV